MDYASLIAEFGASYGMDDLAPNENGVVGFESDGRSVLLRRLPDSQIVIATVGLVEVPTAGAAAVNRLLMQANQALFVQDCMALVFHAESGWYQLLSRIDVATLDFVGFDAKIAQLLDRADQWCTFFEQFLPIAAQSEASDGKIPPPPFDLLGSAGMMRI